MSAEEKTIIGRECRFAVHVPNYKGVYEDYHYVKEAVYYSDGSVEPNTTLIKNFKRSFGVTKPQFQNHQQKKTYEELDRLNIYKATQSELTREVAKALNLPPSNKRLQEYAVTPYLYGSDITSTVVLKQSYRKKWPDLSSPFTVGFFDIETDVLHGTTDPVLATFIFKKDIYCIGVRSFFKGYTDVEDLVQSKCKKYIQEYITKHDYTIHFRLVDTTVELIKKIFVPIHKHQPDFLAIWNMDFDIPKLISTLEKYKVDIKSVFCDPKLPKELQYCRYKKGSTKKRTASGAIKPKKPSEQWHTLICTSSYYVIDAMCTFRFIRQGEQERPNYRLDTILDAELGIRKLSFKEADPYSGLEKHRFLQENYPLEYTVYNIFDCIGMVELEELHSDLSSAFPVRCGITDFAKFNSQTKLFSDSYHFFLLERGKMIATIPPREDGAVGELDVDEEISEDDDEEDESSPSEDDEIDKYNDTLSLLNWIN